YPTIITAHSVHGQETKYRSRFVERVRIAAHEHVMYSHFKDHARHLICISPYIQEHYSGLLNAAMYSIENPIEDGFFALDPERRVQGRVLFAGLLIRRKRPDLLIESASLVRPRVPHLTVHIAGGAADGRLVARLTQAVNLGGLEQNVAFLGHLSEKALLQEYQAASVLVLTSDQETSPMVIQQAMAAGKPVISTRVGGIADLVDHGHNGYLVDRGDAHGIAGYLQEILLDPERARRMGLRARQTALSRFRASSVAGRMIDVYQTVTAGSPARHLVSGGVGVSD
ncbi:MAG: glycosyltransferase family 4 protein, partial [Nitrolancea sp.]